MGRRQRGYTAIQGPLALCGGLRQRDEIRSLASNGPSDASEVTPAGVPSV
ncbi:MAG: hypothetical protein AAGK21_10885 [Bacteroidota bacterium]